MSDVKIEQVYLDAITLKEKKDGIAYTKKTNMNIVILIAGHNEPEPDGGEKV